MACTRNCQLRRNEKTWADESSYNHTKGQDLQNIQKSSRGQVVIIAKDGEGFEEELTAAMELDGGRWGGGEGQLLGSDALMLWASPHAAEVRTLLQQQQRHLLSLGYRTHICTAESLTALTAEGTAPLAEPPSKSTF